MPSRAVIKAAARAARQPAVNAPSLGSGVSPLMASYNNWGGDRYSGVALPRPPEQFAQGGFAPLSPIQPMGVDTPEPGADRPEPRRTQIPVAWNLIHQPGTEGLGKLADFGTLRFLADYSSIARACIQLRKAEIRSLAWDIAPTKDASKVMRGDRGKNRDFGERKAQAVKFFKRPDPAKYADFSAWLDAVLEDIFVIDALSVFLQPTRGKGKGLLGSSLGALAHIDGATIRPLVDLHGAIPRPPAPAYQQYLYGAPRSDLLAVINGDDVDDLDQPAAEYRADQLMYLPMNPRGWTPYGQAPAERCIVPIMASLARQKWQSDYFQEGTVPSVFVSPGDPNLTPQMIRHMQDTLNAIAGDPAWKHKIIVLPGGSHVDPMHQTELADQFDEVISVQVCMGYDVMPMELGISPKVSATQSGGAANQMAKASQKTNERKSLKPLLQFLKTSLFDPVLQEVCGQPDMEWKWEGLEEGEDEEALTAILTQRVNNGLMSHDEARLELGLEPWGLPITADPGVLLAGGFVPLGAIDPTTGMPAGKQPILPEEAAEIPVSGEGWVESQGGGAAAPKPAPGATAAPAATPAHAGAQAAVAQHREQGPTQAAKPTGGTKPAADAKPDPKPAATPAAKPAGTGKTGRSDTRKGWKSVKAPLTGDAATDAVYSQLAEDYPVDALGWVKEADWSGPVEVPIADIDTSNRESWQASDEPDKVERFKRKIKHKLGKGKPLKPIILVQTPTNAKLIVIDGHHRTLAYDSLDLPAIAWVGKVNAEKGPWTILHSKQFPQDNDPATADDTRRTVNPASKAMLAELDALGRHLKKGTRISAWQRRHLPAQVLALIADDLTKGLTVDQVISVARSALPPDDVVVEGAGPAAKASGYSLNPRSGMVSLDLPEGLIPPIPGGVTDHHITVVYLGPDVSDEAFEDACERARAAAAACGPLHGAVSGIGTFPPSNSSDGKIPVWGAVALPGAEQLREALADLSASEHLDWRPHVTLAYLDEGEPLPPPLPPIPVMFTHLSVHRGDEVERFPLGAPVVKAGGGNPKGGGGKAERQHWPAWDVDQQIAAGYAAELRATLGRALNKTQARRIAADWLSVAAPGKSAEAWLQVTYPQLAGQARDALSPVLRVVWRRGWALGEHSARYVLKRMVSKAQHGSAGDAAASASVIDEETLREWLDTAGIDSIRSIGDTRMADLADALDTAMADGSSLDDLAGEIAGFALDPSAADMVAGTELARAISQAALNTYLAAGVQQISWLTAGDERVCEAKCIANQASSPVRIGEPFASGDLIPPSHPRDRCCIQPDDSGGVALPSLADLQAILGGFD